MPLTIGNRDARRLFLSGHGLIKPPTGPLDVVGIVQDLGFVQLDTIQVVARAHHHIIWSRNQKYREPMLDRVFAERALFEHFTHDASILPMAMLPMWRRQFGRMKQTLDRSNWYSAMLDANGRAQIKDRIRHEGPLSTQAFDTSSANPKKMWSRPPHKLALDYMWHTGELATCHRVSFRKFYDLAERVFPPELLRTDHPDEMQIDWLCRTALDRLGIATVQELQKFWQAATPAEVRNWARNARSELTPVRVRSASGNWTDALALPDVEMRIEQLPTPCARLRILNPFDPVVRDRTRLKRLFGFDYRVEMFVPAAERRWGYYVYPILERDHFIGRIEIKADRKAGVLNVLNCWAEPKARWSGAKDTKLAAELIRLGRLVGISQIKWQCPIPSTS